MKETTNSGRTVLIIEDDKEIAELIALHLSDLHIKPTLAHSAKEGLRHISTHAFSALILDLRLPDADGLDVCRKLRGEGNGIPIIMLTAKSTELDRVLGLEIGADDYLVKPFSMMELGARLKAVLRRAEKLSQRDDDIQEIKFDQIILDGQRREVRRNNTLLELTAKEFDLLQYFFCNPGQVFRRSDLLDAVWGYGHEGYEHTVNSHINRLRAKVERDPSDPQLIKTVWGVGYKLNDVA